MKEDQPSQASEGPSIQKVVNDFCMTICTVNGSGSITANSTLLRSFFRMGIPVAGKNVFPSNIQGLPTWYRIRVNKDGFLARVERDQVVVSLNPATIEKDMEYLVPGGAFYFPEDIKFEKVRRDITYYAMPVKKVIKEASVPANLKGYISNMVYVGVLAQMLGIPLEIVESVLDFQFKGNKTAVQINLNVVQMAAEWASSNLDKNDPFMVEKLDPLDGHILADGNIAGALGAAYGGVQFAAWYPITPATSVAEGLYDFLPLLRKDPVTKKNTFAIVQAEDELAAIGMAVGAGWAGLRAMTSTSGPGLSLMAEYLGMAYFAEVPVVVWDVQRVGPSTGLPTRTSQQDLSFAYFIGHGDTDNIILIPGSVQECFEFGWKAFDLAEHFQTPVLVLSDLDLGMNQWVTRKFEYPDQPMDRGKVLWEQGLEKMINRLDGKWGRYLDVDGDGIPYRTLPGNRHPQSAYFTRGTGHDEFARYSEGPETWEKMLNRIKKKFDTAREFVPKPILKEKSGATLGIISMGSADPAVNEACYMMQRRGVVSDYLRICAIPFCSEIGEFIKRYEHVYIVEANRDGQLRQLLILEYPEYAQRLRPVSHTDGLPLSAEWIENQIMRQEEAKK